MLKESGGAMQMHLSVAAFCDGQILQDLGLQRGAKTLRLLDAVVLGGGLEFGKAGDAELLMKPEHLLGSQARHRQHLQDARRDLLTQLLEARMRPSDAVF
jgi:hypothetical protein